MTLVENYRGLTDANQVCEGGLREVFAPRFILRQHIEIWDPGLERLVLLGLIFWRKMLDDIAAAVAEELELVLALPVRACELEDQDVEVALELGRRQPGDLVLLPDLDAAREREFKRLTIEVPPVA